MSEVRSCGEESPDRLYLPNEVNWKLVMRIAMMSTWNAACGVSTHAELIGREWVRMGHELKVFAPANDEKVITDKDESYVTRCYTVDREPVKGLKPSSLDKEVCLESDYDIFIIQNLELMPMDKLLEIWPQIKARAKTIQVIHEGYPPPYPEFYRFDPDAIVCFDERYLKLFSRKFLREKIRIIPFPCHPLELGDRARARRKLGLPLEKKIIFTYGLSMWLRLFPLPAVAELAKTYDLLWLMISAEGGRELLNRAKGKYRFIEARYAALSLEELYTYLHAADALLLYTQNPNMVVSSMVYLCLGSGCPIIISEGRYTEDLGEEVFKYRDFDELKEVLAEVFAGRKPEQKAVEKFMAEKSARGVAQRFIGLFESL